MSHDVDIREVEGYAEVIPGTQIAFKLELCEGHKPFSNFLYKLVTGKEYYYHHGVYLGGYRVAHFDGTSKKNAKPQECELYEFSQRGIDTKLYIVTYPDEAKKRPVEETIDKAEEMLKDPSKWRRYNILINNCETFATWLVTGEMRSEQVRDAAKRAVSSSSSGRSKKSKKTKEEDVETQVDE